MKYIFSIAIIMLFISSCTTTNFISIQTRQPAKVSFPPEVTKVVIVDNCIPDEDETNLELKKSRAAILSTDSARAILLNSMSQFMNEENYFSNVGLYPYKTGNNKKNEIAPLPAGKIKSICKELDADALIALDLLAVSVELETENTGYFSSYSFLKANIGGLLSVYSKEGVEYIKPIVYLDSLFRAESTDWSRVKKNVPEINSMITEITTIAADKLTGNFIPSWKTQERWYYSDSSSEMKKAEKFVKQEKWEAAADIWGNLYDKENSTKKKMRLASNIALANEYLDDVENALNWINIAFEMLPSESKSDLALEIASFRTMLISRVSNMPQLNEQLGIVDSTSNGE